MIIEPKVEIDKPLSFYELLSKQEIKKVVIPIIQRDYAQGRVEQHEIEEIRKKFVLDIKTALVSNEKMILDCVYGFVDDERNFIPIDGQQRLTTLFLLHWYLAISAKEYDDFAKSILMKFTYQLRESAKEFCESLSKDSDVISFDIRKTIGCNKKC